MKKLLYLAIIPATLITNAAFGQGTVNLANSLGTLVTAPGLTTNGLAPVGTRVELFYQPGGGSAPAPMVINGDGGYFIGLGSWEATAGSNPFAMTGVNGRFAAGGQTTGTDVPVGANAWFTVVAWTGGFSTIQGAIEGGGIIAESSIFELVTGDAGVPPTTPVLLTASTAAQGFVAGTPFGGIALTPEPSSIALGVFGAASLLFFRRRK